jgi:hypothetical protein
MNAELVPPGTSDSDVRDEVNRRTHRAGYTDRDGQPMIRREIVSQPATEAYRAGWDRVFGHS